MNVFRYDEHGAANSVTKQCSEKKNQKHSTVPVVVVNMNNNEKQQFQRSKYIYTNSRQPGSLDPFVY